MISLGFSATFILGRLFSVKFEGARVILFELWELSPSFERWVLDLDRDRLLLSGLFSFERSI